MTSPRTRLSPGTIWIFSCHMEEVTDERIISTLIDVSAAGQRLDHYLARRFTYRSRHQWQQIVRDGKILVDGRRVRCSRVMREGDTISFIPDEEEPPADMVYEIIFEDEFFMVVDKGGNLPCHPAGAYFRNTLWYALRERFGELHIVNRLDRETSGLLLAAKNARAASGLAEMFNTGNVCKSYVALVHGIFDREINADGFLVPDTVSQVRKKRRFVMAGDTVPVEGESAGTLLRLLSVHGDLSMVEALPSTGRLHQIRATLHSLGYPLVGDKLYGLDDNIFLRFAAGMMSEEDWTRLRLRRQALHARSLEFVHPFTGSQVCLDAPPPQDFFPDDFPPEKRLERLL